MARGKRPVTFRTRKLSLPAPMVLPRRRGGRVGRRRTTIPEGPPALMLGALRCFQERPRSSHLRYRSPNVGRTPRAGADPSHDRCLWTSLRTPSTSGGSTAVHASPREPERPLLPHALGGGIR